MPAESRCGGGLAAALLLAVLAAGCATAPGPGGARWTGLETADDLFRRGELAAATGAYEEFLAAGVGRGADWALFQLVILYASDDNPLADEARARERQERLGSEFPESPWGPYADRYLALCGEIARLQRDRGKLGRELESLRQQLEQLKRIDLERKPPGSGR